MSTFDTKEQYLNYISAWKSATNAEECKSKRVVCDHVQYYWEYHGYTDEEQARFREAGYTKISKYSHTIPNGGHYKEEGWLNASHYVMHNAMRGKDPKRGFSPMSERKIQEPNSPWYGFEQGALHLEYIINDARLHIEHSGQGKQSLAGRSATQFLVPFQGKLTLADLLRIDVEELANARKFHR